jgi:hypothetical protein
MSTDVFNWSVGLFVSRPPGFRKHRFLPFLVFPLVLIIGSVTVAWLKPGFVECRGFLEPESWIPVYTPSDGIIVRCELNDGTPVDKDEVLVEWDDEWPLWNLSRIAGERIEEESELTYLRQRLRLFGAHRDIEAGELQRLAENNRILYDNSSLTTSEYLRSVYRREAFEAGAEREAADIVRELERVSESLDALAVEELLWRSRLDDCRLTSPTSGRFYFAESIYSNGSQVLIPSLGPGRRVDSGRLLGYVIPECGMVARIEIPQRFIHQCIPGQRALLTLDTRPTWAYPPVEGTLTSVSDLSAGGFIAAAVEISLDESGEAGTPALLNCADLTARIDVRACSAQKWPARTWERFVLLVNSFPEQKKRAAP